jgi:ATP phosphoribosyltransferase
VKKANLKKLLANLPALKNPTIAPLADEDWCSVNTIIEKDCLINLLPKIRKLAQGIVVYEPRQVLALDEITRRESDKCQSKPG